MFWVQTWMFDVWMLLLVLTFFSVAVVNGIIFGSKLKLAIRFYSFQCQLTVKILSLLTILRSRQSSRRRCWWADSKEKTTRDGDVTRHSLLPLRMRPISSSDWVIGAEGRECEEVQESSSYPPLVGKFSQISQKISCLQICSSWHYTYRALFLFRYLENSNQFFNKYPAVKDVDPYRSNPVPFLLLRKFQKIF